MWLLLIIFLNPPLLTQQELNTFGTYENCRLERNRIGFDMAEAYPSEHTFDIVCELRRGVLVV